jgi:biopolymer transport protein ExbB
MNSQFGLANVWSQGDIVTKSVALLLLLMSLASWMVILIKTLDLIKYKRLARSAEDFWHSEDFAAGLTKLGEDPGNRFVSWHWKAVRPRPTTATPRRSCATRWT